MRCFYFKAIRRGYYLYAYLNSSTLNSFSLNPSTTTFSQTSKSTQQRDFQKLFLLIVFNVDQNEDFVKHRIFEWKCMLRGNTFRCKFFRLVVGYESLGCLFQWVSPRVQEDFKKFSQIYFFDMFYNIAMHLVI